jgi:tetratricopeptide (TPR) repeat protein
MTPLHLLRQLADQQQFTELKATAETCWAETGEPGALPLLALACVQLGERGLAAEYSAASLAHLDALDNAARVDIAAVHCLFWQIIEAIALLEPVLAAEPAHSLALARLAWCRMQQGELSEACRLYQHSAQLAPHRLPVWIALTRLHLEAGDGAAAQRALDTAIVRLSEQCAVFPVTTLEAFTAQLRGLQLDIWVSAGQIAEAEQWLETRRASLPEDTWVALLLGYANLLAGHDRHSEAEEALRNALKHIPENIALVAQLAELSEIQGRSWQSIRLLRRAIHLAELQDKPAIGFWPRLSAATLQQSDEQARQAADKAIELAAALTESEAMPAVVIEQLRLQAKHALAQVESQVQHFELAETLFNEMLTVNPYFVPVLQSLGQQQMQRGKIDEAIALFERIKEIDPAKGYSALINARRFPEDDDTLARMEKLARQPSQEGAVRSSILFQLAAAWEKRKDYAKAFALADEANSASRKHLKYDPKAHRNHCARIRHAFPAALYQHRPDCGYRGDDESLPVFVLGMPRSGTTLVEQIIAGHSQIFGAGELGIIPQRIQGLNRWERHVGSGREFPDCIDDLNPYVTAGIANGILEELKALAAEAKPEARFVVDKLPHNFENIGLIKFLFPHAKIISVRRDPRDIAISNYFTDYMAKHGGMGFAYDLDWIGEQLADHNLLMRHWQQVFPGEILEINYEDVVENTEAMARRMLDYIGVDWEPQVLNFSELERPVKTASVWQVRQPIYKTSTAKWMRYQEFLAPLIAGTNRKMAWDNVEMVTLPEPGLLTQGVALYKADQLDEAEYEFKKLLHHLPEYAAANHLLGLIYARKNYLSDAIPLMLKALEKCPWNPDWRKDLIQAYELAGETDKAEALQKKLNQAAAADDTTTLPEDDWPAWLQAGSEAPAASAAQP